MLASISRSLGFIYLSSMFWIAAVCFESSPYSELYSESNPLEQPREYISVAKADGVEIDSIAEEEPGVLTFKISIARPTDGVVVLEQVESEKAHPENIIDQPLYGVDDDPTLDEKAGGADEFIDQPLYDAIAAYHRAEAEEEAMASLQDILTVEALHANEMRRSGRSSGRRNTFRFVQQFMGSTLYAKQLSYPSILQSAILTFTKEKFGLSKNQIRHLMKTMPRLLKRNAHTMMPHHAPPRANPRQCPYPENVVCDPVAKYRTYDGRCNNLKYPLRGASHTPLQRFVEPDYADGIGKPRKSKRGRKLPSARLVSATIHWDFDIPHHMHTLMLMQMGQFLDHDMSRTAISKMTVNPTGFGQELEEFECGDNGCETEGLINHPCFPIHVHRNDTDFGGRKPCLMFVRSQEVPNAECKPGPREQLNQLTSYLDASHIYGSTEKEANELRDIRPDRGRMKVVPHPAGRYKDMLPIDPKLKMCRGDNRTILCFKAGDGRVNEFSGLTTQHLVWIREHNRIEEKLHQMNGHWDGERLFQETRRIITAMWQFCVYNEYLPVILGPEVMEAYGLTLLTEDGYWNDYDQNTNAGIANSFATAAMRFGHTQLQGIITGRDALYQSITDIPLSTQLRRPHLMYQPPHQGMDMMMLGMVGQSTQRRDPFMTKQVTRHLFAENPPGGLGEDLMSLNMQRGRDHGLPGYNSFRELCGLSRAKGFHELVELPAEVIQRLSKLYASVDDIDLWPAGISEKSSGLALLGPTFTCILARQFKNLKFGDRYWFENNVHNPYPFTVAQLREIRSVKYSKVMCTNADHMPSIQANVFIHPISQVLENLRSQNIIPDTNEMFFMYGNTNNERVDCSSLTEMNLEAWREPPPHPSSYSDTSPLHLQSAQVPFVFESATGPIVPSLQFKEIQQMDGISNYTDDSTGSLDSLNTLITENATDYLK